MSNSLPDGWEISQFDEICSIANGQVDPKDPIFGEMKHIGPGNIEKFSGRLTNVRTAIEDGQTSGKYRFSEDDVLYGKINPHFAKVAFPKYSGVCSADIYPIRVKKAELAPGFLFQSLLSERFTAYAVSVSGRTGMPKINREDLALYPFLLPPILEQQKIASILTAVDEVIESTQAQINKLKDLKTGMMQELLTKGIGRDGQPHTEFKDSPVGRIPKAWKLVELEVVAKIIDCKHATPRYFNTGYPVVKPGNIKEDNLDLNGCAFTDKDGFDNLNENHTPQVGDTIYSRNQTYGIGAYVNVKRDFAIGQDVCVIHPTGCHSKFLFYTINSPILRRQVDLLAAGSTFKRINLGAIRKLLFPVPSISEQETIQNVLSSIDLKIKVTASKLEFYRHEKKALMQDLLSGNVRVTLLD